jgi:hypothetical protein
MGDLQRFLVARLPLLGVAVVVIVSATQTSCGSGDSNAPDDAASDATRDSQADVPNEASVDAPLEDTKDDLDDGFSYDGARDGY